MSPTDDPRRTAPATARNREAIFDVLTRYMVAGSAVLEIGSGTGEHAAWFAPKLASIDWYPSDLSPENLDSISAWAKDSRAENLKPPRLLDVLDDDWTLDIAKPLMAIVAINVIHISPWDVTPALMAAAAHNLAPGGILYLYGPYRQGGKHTAPSNEAFEQWLKDQNPAWGVRNMEDVVAEAAAQGLTLAEMVAMPANNFVLVFRRD